MKAFCRWIVILGVATGCSSSNKKLQAGNGSGFTATSALAAGDGATSITKAEADLRAAQLGNIHYDLFVDVGENSAQSFTGKMHVTFDLLQFGGSVRLDLFNALIKKVEINGAGASPNYNGRYMTLAGSSFKAGPNDLTIEYAQNFAGSSDGFWRFEDPADKTIYMGTNFEPFGANRLFPCFDQPDLKANFKLKVRAPRDFTVVSTVRESDVINDPDGRHTWQFPEGPKIATYVFSLFAGPYRVFASTKKSGVPMRLLVRESLAKYVEPKAWLDMAHAGIEFYQDYFSTPFPYPKYDQLIVPVMQGAMENVGAVSFGESFVARGPQTRNEKLWQADVLLHELGHMWFGNLVTTRWWNDLWLNESFADFVSDQAMMQVTPYKETVQTRIEGRHESYLLDSTSATHPVTAEVPDTTVAMARFDRITYIKGAATLEQLKAFMGEANFHKALAAYFKKYGGGNATLADFIAVMGQQIGKDLSGWQNQWLTTTGFNHIQTDWQCSEGTSTLGPHNLLTHLTVRQTTGSQSRVLRQHALKLALIHQKSSKIKKGKQFVTTTTLASGPVLPVILINDQVEVPVPAGTSCPAAVYPNAEDQSYLQADWSHDTVGKILPYLSSLPDPFLRNQIWTSLWSEVEDSHLNVFEYKYWLVAEGLEKDTDPTLLRSLYARVSRTFGYPSILTFMPRTTAQEKVEYQDQLAGLEDVSWKRLKNAAPGSELQRLFFDNFVSLAETKLALDNVRSLLNGRAGLPGFHLHQDMRWDLVRRLARAGQSDAEDLIAAELQHDMTSRGQEQALSARAMLPSWPDKAKIIAYIKSDPSPLTASQRRVAGRSLLPLNQLDLRATYAPQFYGDLKAVQEREAFAGEFYFVALAPDACEEKGSAEMAAQAKSGNYTAPVQKSLQQLMEMGLRCQKAMALARQGGFRPPDLPQVPDTGHKRRRHRRHR